MSQPLLLALSLSLSMSTPATAQPNDTPLALPVAIRWHRLMRFCVQPITASATSNARWLPVAPCCNAN